MKILSLITDLMSFQSPKILFIFETEIKIFLMNIFKAKLNLFII